MNDQNSTNDKNAPQASDSTSDNKNQNPQTDLTKKVIFPPSPKTDLSQKDSDKIDLPKTTLPKDAKSDSLFPSRNPFPHTPSPIAKLKDPHTENLKILQEALGEENVQENVLLSKYTTFRIGGPAEFFFEAKNIDDLIKAIVICREFNFLKNPEDVTEEDKKDLEEKEKIDNLTKPKSKSPYGLGPSPFASQLGTKKQLKYKLPFFILGGGSNVIIADRGVPGLTIKNSASKVNIGSELVEAYAGTPTSYLLQKVLDADLSGMEFLDGVPGTIGGAVYNNAKSFFLGDFYQKPPSIHQIIYDMTVMTKEGKVLIRKPSHYHWYLTYNNIPEFGDIIMVVRLKLHNGVSKKAEKYLVDYHQFRRQKPYMKYPSVGSIFRNPEGLSAGKLIDDCGLKGLQQGGAQISAEHGNIFINSGDAKASDVRYLINLAKQKVLEKFRIEITEEIQYVGDFRTDSEIDKIKAKLKADDEKVTEKDKENEDDFSLDSDF